MPTCTVRLDANPNTPTRLRRVMQQMAQIINNGLLAGEGLGLNADCQLQVNVTAPIEIVADALQLSLADGLAVDTGDLVVALATDPGLEFTAGDLRVKVKTDGGVVRDGDGLNIEQTRRDLHTANWMQI